MPWTGFISRPAHFIYRFTTTAVTRYLLLGESVIVTKGKDGLIDSKKTNRGVLIGADPELNICVAAVCPERVLVAIQAFKC